MLGLQLIHVCESGPDKSLNVFYSVSKQTTRNHWVYFIGHTVQLMSTILSFPVNPPDKRPVMLNICVLAVSYSMALYTVELQMIWRTMMLMWCNALYQALFCACRPFSLEHAPHLHQVCPVHWHFQEQSEDTSVYYRIFIIATWHFYHIVCISPASVWCLSDIISAFEHGDLSLLKLAL